MFKSVQFSPVEKMDVRNEKNIMNIMRYCRLQISHHNYYYISPKQFNLFICMSLFDTYAGSIQPVPIVLASL